LCEQTQRGAKLTLSMLMRLLFGYVADIELSHAPRQMARAATDSVNRLVILSIRFPTNEGWL
jgi:hypothetical protein